MDTDKKFVQEISKNTHSFLISWALILQKYFFKLETVPV